MYEDYPISDRLGKIARSAAPAADPTEHELFDELKTTFAQAKIRSPQEWGALAAQSAHLLVEVGKDIRILGYYTRAIVGRFGMAGLAPALENWADALDEQWDSFHPKDPSKRLKFVPGCQEGLFRWATAQLSKVTTEELPALSAAAVQVDRLEEVFDRRPGAAGQSWWDARERIRDMLAHLQPPPAPARIEAPAPPPEPVKGGPPVGAPVVMAPVPAPPPPGPAPAPPPPTNSLAPGRDTSPDALAEIFRKNRPNLLLLTAAMRRNAPKAAWHYRLSRDFVWGTLQPPDADQGRTTLGPPDPEYRADLLRLAKKGAWAELLEEAETAWAPPRLLWLDPHRFVVQALRGLGATEAADGVESCLRDHRPLLATLATLHYADGSPLADEDSTRWLARLWSEGARPLPPPPPAPLPAVPSLEGSPSGSEAVAVGPAGPARWRSLLETGDSQLALAEAEVLLRTVGPGRDRFDLSLSVAETLLASSSSSALATPILIALRPDLEQQNLDHWEPALALRAYRAMLQVARQAPCPGLQPPEELLNRLLRLGGLGALTGTRL